MNREELRAQLISADVNPRKYCLDGDPPRASEGIVLSHSEGKWIVRSFDRGAWFTEGVFASELEACRKVWELLADPFYHS